MQLQTTKVAKASGRGSKPGERRGGRQKGTPNKATGEVRDIARLYGAKAIEAAAKLAGLVSGDDGVTPNGMATSEQARIAALGIILDRAYGKAPQAHTGEDGEGPVRQVLEVVWASAKG